MLQLPGAVDVGQFQHLFQLPRAREKRGRESF
jgi:hypothetical protein